MKLLEMIRRRSAEALMASMCFIGLTLLVLGTVMFARVAHADVNHGYPGLKVSVLTLNATTATKATLHFTNRDSVGICNLSGTTVYLGADNTVTDLTGFPLAPNGACTSLPLSYNGLNGLVDVWFYATVGQAATTNLRFAEAI